MHELARDIRFTVRLFLSKKHRVIAAAAVLTIGVTLAAATVVLSFADAILVRPLPFRESDRLVGIQLMSRDHYHRAAFGRIVPRALVQAWRSQSTEVAALAGYSMGYSMLTGAGSPQIIPALSVTDGMFDLLGVRPIIGAALPRAEGGPSSDAVLLSHKLWATQFGSDTGIVGRSITLADRRYRVVGVMPAGFRIPFSIPETEKDGGEVWLRLGNRVEAGTAPSVAVLASLKRGALISRVEMELNRITEASPLALGPTVAEQHDPARLAQVAPMKRLMAAQVRPLLLILLGATGCLLCIACANVAVLLSAIAASRKGEIAVRMALGAPPRRVFQQLVLESILLASAGGAIGVLLAKMIVPLLVRTAGQRLPDVGPITVDWRVLAAAMIVVAVVGIASSLLPAFHAARGQPKDQLAAGWNLGGARSRHGLGTGLVMLQIGISVLLLSAMGLLARSFRNLTDPRGAYDPNGLIAASVALVGDTYDSPVSRIHAASAIAQNIAGVRGVRDVAMATGAPLLGGYHTGVRAVGDGSVGQVDSDVWAVSPDYFSVLRMRLLRGRTPTGGDRPNVVVIDEAAAAAIFPGVEPLGQRLRIGTGTTETTVIGIVSNVEDVINGADASAARRMVKPHVYTTIAAVAGRSLRALVRVDNVSAGELRAIHGAIVAFDPKLSLTDPRPMRIIIDQRFGKVRFLSLLSCLIAVIAFVIAAAGLYAVMLQRTTQRMRELSLRLALGAAPRKLVAMTMRRGLALAASGLAVGLVLNVLALRVLKPMLFEVSLGDPLVLGLAALAIGGIAAVSSFLPSRRAMLADPAAAMRGE